MLLSNSTSPYLGTALQITRVQYVRYERFVNQKQEGLVAGVCWFSMTSVKLSADSVDEEKKSPVKAGNDSFWKWSWLTSPSIHSDLKKSRRCYEKESSILSKRIVGAKRENRRFFLKESSVLMGSKSIYSPKSLNCYVSGGNNTWQKHSKMALMYSSNSIGWMTSAFSRAICLPSGSCHADRADSPMVCLCMWLKNPPICGIRIISRNPLTNYKLIDDIAADLSNRLRIQKEH